MQIRFFLAAAVAAFAVACTTTPPESAPPTPEIRVVTECSFIHPLTFSRNDTPETKREIIGQADAIAANCPNMKPAQ